VTARAAGREFPTEGREVTARNGFTGTVQRVFGPVARPYLAIRPRRPLRAAEASQLLGAPLSGRL
jgi:rRNA processing protein Gar1